MIEIRNITEDDVDLFRTRFAQGFGRDPSTDPEARKRFDALFDRGRAFAAFDGPDVVGTLATLDLEVTVPGGARLPMAGTTSISVMPTHRRRGVLRDLMSRHLDEIGDRGEPLAGLWASEAAIYGRFGYGAATFRHHLEVDTKTVTMRDRGDAVVRLASPKEELGGLREVHEAARGRIAGFLSRSDDWWALRVLADHESWRGGKTSLRCAVAERDQRPVGYALFRQESKWDDFMPGGLIEVEEMVTIDPEAHRSLWNFLLGIDLFTRLEWFNLPVDDPLPHAVVDPRRLRRRTLDGMWVRLMDVAAALSSRAYSHDGALTIEVEGEASAGVYRLEVSGGRAECVETSGDADIRCRPDVLGHLYLGGGDAMAMAAAGRLAGSVESTTLLHRMFRGDLAPWCPEVF